MLRRLTRHAFTLCAVVSLLLCVTACALWLRSLTHFEMVQLRHARWPRADEHRMLYLSVAWYSNTLRVELVRSARLPEDFQVLFRGSQDGMEGYRAQNPPGLRWDFVGEDTTREMNGFPPGFAARHWPERSGQYRSGDRWVVSSRPWLPALMTAVLPAAWVSRALATRRRRRAGLCAHCGYDLRATPGRCPECGAAPAGAPADAAA